MNEQKHLTCIGCPMGCALTVTVDGETVLSVEGNTCRRGDAYARQEVAAPARVLTTTLPVAGGQRPTVAVRTAGEIPKALLLPCVQALSALTISAPIAAGQVLVPDLLGTGVDLVAAEEIPACI